LPLYSSCVSLTLNRLRRIQRGTESFVYAYGSLVHRKDYAYSGDDLPAIERTARSDCYSAETRFVRDGVPVVQERMTSTR
jgi:cation transport regulator ChaC